MGSVLSIATNSLHLFNGARTEGGGAVLHFPDEKAAKAKSGQWLAQGIRLEHGGARI